MITPSRKAVERVLPRYIALLLMSDVIAINYPVILAHLDKYVCYFERGNERHSKKPASGVHDGILMESSRLQFRQMYLRPII